MTRLRAKTRGFQYAADAASQALIDRAGGLSRLTPEQLAGVRFKTVAIGEWCDDMPAAAAARYLERGDIEAVTVETPAVSRRAKESD